MRDKNRSHFSFLTFNLNLCYARSAPLKQIETASKLLETETESKEISFAKQTEMLPPFTTDSLVPPSITGQTTRDLTRRKND